VKTIILSEPREVIYESLDVFQGDPNQDPLILMIKCEEEDQLSQKPRWSAYHRFLQEAKRIR
jgi:hypothetical protein